MGVGLWEAELAGKVVRRRRKKELEGISLTPMNTATGTAAEEPLRKQSLVKRGRTENGCVYLIDQKCCFWRRSRKDSNIFLRNEAACVSFLHTPPSDLFPQSFIPC